jgi:hypothetical protein
MPVFSALFLISFFLYLWLRIDPALLWGFMRFREFPCFRKGAEFLGDFLPYPGGPIGYLAAFLSQLYYWSWLGSLIVTLLGGLLCLATYGVFQALGGTRVRALYFVPAVLLLALYNLYGHLLAAALALLAALLFVNIYSRWAPRSAWLRLPAFLLLSAAVYYLTAGAYLVFAALCGILELLTRRRPFLGACYIACVVGVPYLAERCVFPVSTVEASLRLIPFSLAKTGPIPTVALGLYLFCPVVGLVIAIVRRFGGGRLRATEGTLSPSGQQSQPRSLSSWPPSRSISRWTWGRGDPFESKAGRARDGGIRSFEKPSTSRARNTIRRSIGRSSGRSTTPAGCPRACLSMSNTPGAL